jgi:hypothetical protein
MGVARNLRHIIPLIALKYSLKSSIAICSKLEWIFYDTNALGAHGVRDKVEVKLEKNKLKWRQMVLI